MNTIKLLAITMVLTLSITTTLFAQKKTTKTVVYDVHIHCDDCQRKIEESMPFQKGVKNVEVNKDDQKVAIEYNPEKTDKEKLHASFEKLNLEFKESSEEYKIADKGDKKSK